MSRASKISMTHLLMFVLSVTRHDEILHSVRWTERPETTTKKFILEDKKKLWPLG